MVTWAKLDLLTGGQVLSITERLETPVWRAVKVRLASLHSTSTQERSPVGLYGTGEEWRIFSLSSIREM